MVIPWYRILSLSSWYEHRVSSQYTAKRMIRSHLFANLHGPNVLLTTIWSVLCLASTHANKRGWALASYSRGACDLYHFTLNNLMTSRNRDTWPRRRNGHPTQLLSFNCIVFNNAKGPCYYFLARPALRNPTLTFRQRYFRYSTAPPSIVYPTQRINIQAFINRIIGHSIDICVRHRGTAACSLSNNFCVVTLLLPLSPCAMQAPVADDAASLLTLIGECSSDLNSPPGDFSSLCTNDLSPCLINSMTLNYAYGRVKQFPCCKRVSPNFIPLCHRAILGTLVSPGLLARYTWINKSRN